MPDPDVEQEIEDLEDELARKRDRLSKLRAQREEQEVEDLEQFEDLSPSERRRMKEENPDRWKRMMQGRRERAESRLMDTTPDRL